MICHCGETLCAKHSVAHVRRGKKGFHEPRLRYINVDLGFYRTTTLWSPLNMAEYRQTKTPMMHSDVQALKKPPSLG